MILFLSDGLNVRTPKGQIVILTWITFDTVFEPMPENGGFNSTRIAEILNFRKSLPPTVTVAHVHALTPSPTTTEREIAELTTAGTIRRTVTPGRGTGGSSVGEGLILSRDLERLVKESAFLDKDLAEKFIACLRANPIAVGISRSSFTPSETRALMHSGFLTSITRDLHSTEAFSRPGAASSRTATSISSISRAASGSVAAVGGEDAIAGAGGRGGIRRSSSQLEKQPEQEWLEPFLQGEELKLSLPGTGPYLKLLTAARSHLVSLITKSKFREIPEYLLRERWDGGIAADDPAARAKKYRGEFKGILPSQSWKWKQFYGIAFDWVLAECLGAGSVEIFETRSVGRALRIP